MGYFCNEHLFNQLVEKGSNSSHARQQLENKLLRGLIENLSPKDTLSIISYLPDVLKIKEREELWNGSMIKYLWCNKKNPISVVKALFKNVINVINWNKGKDSKVIFIYSVNLLHVIPVLVLRKWLKYKVVTLCPEVSVYRKNEKKQVVSLISRKIEHRLDNSFDGYIVLTKYMNEIVNIRNKPYIVMEGIADISTDEYEAQKIKAILYAGGLNKDNGIEILLQAFDELKNVEWELWICGKGELRERVKQVSIANSNIKYYGIIPNEKVLALEKRATLLINPRLTSNTFTRYSFPSKTMEYMASGTATIITRLEGIPEEYFEFVYVWEDETVLGMCNFLKKMFKEDVSRLYQKGKKAQQFVLQNKSVSQQGKCVLEFLSYISKKGRK